MQRIGRYLSGPEIASGGMATVSLGKLAVDDGRARIVAIKRMHPQYAKDPGFAAMFLDEARIASSIVHPNVGSVVDVISSDRELILVLDYVHGETLATILRTTRRPVPERILSAILIDVLRGLECAHQLTSAAGENLDIVHRDVSPQNIIVGVDGVTRLLDFGVAKAAVRAQTTREGQIKGKLAYMAPEQLIEGTRVDRRADLYSTGVVLWESLAGKRLFVGDNEQQIFLKILSGIVAPLPDSNPSLETGWNDVVERAVAVSADMRFSTARELADAIGSVMTPAAAAAVGSWVQTSCAESLASRARLVESLERGTFDESGGHGLDRRPGLPAKHGALTPTTRLTPVMETEAEMATRIDVPLPSREGRTPLALGVGLAVAVVVFSISYVHSRGATWAGSTATRGTEPAVVPSGIPAVVEWVPASGFFDDFERDTLGPNYLSTSDRYRIEKGRLVVNEGYNHPLWLRARMPDDAVVEFDCGTDSKMGDIKVEVFGDGASTNRGDGAYPYSGYAIIFGGYENDRSIIERIDGKIKPIRRETKVIPGRNYHFKIVRARRRVDWFIDDMKQPFLSFDDPQPLVGAGHDHFAFGDWETPVWFDNLSIKNAGAPSASP